MPKNRSRREQEDAMEAEFRQQMLAVVAQQIEMNTPPSTKRHHRRLMAEGLLDDEACGQIAFVVAMEMASAGQDGGTAFNPMRFEQALAILPLADSGNTRLDRFYGLS